LTGALNRIADAAIPDEVGPKLPGTIYTVAGTAPSGRTPSTSRRLVLVAFVATAVIAAFVVSPSGKSTKEGSSASEVTAATLARAPIASVAQPAFVDNDDLLFVWGGYLVVGRQGEESVGDETASGALWLKGPRRWRPVSESPLSPRKRAAIVDLGDGILVVGGVTNRVGVHQDGAIYDVSSDTWRSVASAPICPAAAARLGDLVVAVGGCTGGEDLAVAAYDLEADRWTRLPNAPLEGVSSFVALDSGTAALAWAVNRGAILDARTLTWTEVDAPNVEGGVQQVGITASPDGGAVAVVESLPTPPDDKNRVTVWRYTRQAGWHAETGVDVDGQGDPSDAITMIGSTLVWSTGHGYSWFDFERRSEGSTPMNLDGIRLDRWLEVLARNGAGSVLIWGGMTGPQTAPTSDALVSLKLR
jgi:hypothetical protein